MTAAERGALLLCAPLPDSEKPLTMAQFRLLSQRANALGRAGDPLRDVCERDLLRLGYDEIDAARIVRLLSREALLDTYLAAGERRGIYPLTRLSPAYPARLRQTLRMDCPPVLFYRGDASLLSRRMIGLVGSRQLLKENRAFAEQAGRTIAKDGFTLVSGGATGADSAAQTACLRAGGSAVIFPAASLLDCDVPKDTCYLSEGCYDAPFSAQRALTRNRFIHVMAEKTFVAQTGHGIGGTWSGATDNLRHGYSPVFVFADGSAGAAALAAQGAEPVREVSSIDALEPSQLTF